jgi:hypothetical protein
MNDYEVTLHTHIGRLFHVRDSSAQAAEEQAMRRYVEEGDDGDEVVYETVQEVEVKAMEAQTR